VGKEVGCSRADSIVDAVSGAAVGRDHLRDRVGSRGELVLLSAVPTEPSRGAWLVRARRRKWRKQRRDPLEQCPDNHGNVRGGVTLGRSGVSFAGAISRRTPRSRAVGNTAVRWVPKRCKAPRSFGNRRPSRGGGGRGSWPCPGPGGESPAPPSQECGDPGARGNVRGGELTRQRESPSLGRPRPALVRAKAKAFESGSRGSSSLISPCVRKHARPSAKAEKLGDERGFGVAAQAVAKREAAASRNSRTRIEPSKGVPVRRVVLQKSAGGAWPREA